MTRVRTFALLLVLSVRATPSGDGGSPVRRAWIMGHTPAGSIGGAARVQPDVQSLAFTDTHALVGSAGISLAYLGPLQSPPIPRETFRQFLFRIPLAPNPASGPHSHVPADFVGAFLNGVPIPNQFEGASYRGQNLWHYDPIARGAASPGLIEKLIPGRGSHSPIIGFALDGYPIYGPWAFEGSELRRVRSSYKLRGIKVRDTWPDGTRLAPGQYGPAVDTEFPLGTFAEDYEYAANSGDLDEYNGKFAVTPEYPDGTYAYFLATDNAGRLAFPYLLAHEYFGNYEGVEDAARLRFKIPDARGRPIRYLEYVHERPLHLMIVSEDLSEFHHIHPEVAADSAWEVSHAFRRGGRHRLYLEFTPPGSNRRVEFVDVLVDGVAEGPVAPTAERNPVLTVSLDSRPPVRAGEDVELSFDVRDPETGGSVRGLQPYLGAWAHFVLIQEGLGNFIHAHPLADGESPIGEAGEHSHTAQALGPPPRKIRVLTSFPEAGRYKLWAQFQVSGKVETVPFSVQVAEPARHVGMSPAATIPDGAIRVSITSSGFDPARVEIPAGKPTTLAFLRDGASNCGSKVVFPDLGISRDIRPGEAVVIDLPASAARELRFACGMGMYRGSIVAR